MKSSLIFLALFMSGRSLAGGSFGGTPPAKQGGLVFDAETNIDGSLTNGTPAVEISKEEFAKATLEAVSGQTILLDGREHRADFLDFKKREILLQELDGSRLIRLKELTFRR